MGKNIDIKIIFEDPSRFEKQNLSGGYSSQIEKVIDKETNLKYTLKKIGESDEEIKNALISCKHIQEYCNKFPLTAKLLNWEIINGTLYCLSEFIEESEPREATIDEIIHISSRAYNSAIQYDAHYHRELDYSKTTLQIFIENCEQNYNRKYYLPYVDNETEEIIDWMVKWVKYFSTDKTFYNLYHEKTGFIHKDIHKRNIIISKNSPYLIDFDMAGIDSLLIELVRPTTIFINRESFFAMYNRIKNENRSKFTQTEIEIIDRVLILDIIFMMGWDATTIFDTKDKSLKLEFIDFLKDRLHYLLILKKHKNELNLDFI